MKKIASFTINHLQLLPGVYVSRRDQRDGTVVTTFDLRCVAPNRESALDGAAMHTFEHLAATWFRNSEIAQQVVYFGPMGCQTGFYLLLFGNWTAQQAMPYVKQCCQFIADYRGDIPGASPAECGNWSYQNLDVARDIATRYLNELVTYARTEY